MKGIYSTLKLSIDESSLACLSHSLSFFRQYLNFLELNLLQISFIQVVDNWIVNHPTYHLYHNTKRYHHYLQPTSCSQQSNYYTFPNSIYQNLLSSIRKHSKFNTNDNAVLYPDSYYYLEDITQHHPSQF